MQSSRKTRIIIVVIFSLSIALRLALALVNREANDDHMEVVRYMLSTGTLPTKANCWECFQPKIFHYVVALALQSFGLINAGVYTQTLAAQLINFVAGGITLGVVWLFIRRVSLKDENLRICAFALVAFNPKLIGISAQATNDTFAILFSTLSLYFTWIFLRKQDFRDFLLVVLWVVLGISSKANVWVTAIAILMSLMIKVRVQGEGRAKTAAYAAAFLLAVPILTVINPLNQYIANYREYGSPVVVNVEKPSQLPPVGSPRSFRPGILSIADGFFTFKFTELLRYPRIENGYENYPAHRTSFWTQLYGRAHSVHFDNWPKSWSTTGTDGFMLTRSIFVLALIPTILLLTGFVMESGIVLKAIVKRDLPAAQKIAFGLFALVFTGYIAFVALYAMEYRDFSVMKAIFVFPALLSFPILFLQTAETLFAYLSTKLKWGRIVLGSGIAVLIILYVTDVVTLIFRLLERFPHSLV